MEQQRLWIAVVVAMAMMVLPFNCLAAEYTVGDSSGWTLGVNYTNWASGKTFAVGDKLVFKYTVGQHDTLVVNQAAYTSCVNTNPLSSHTTGNDTITLDSTGTKYYICGITGHCSGGMKLSITVGPASTSKNNATAPSPSPIPSATPTASSPYPTASTTPTTPTTSSPSPSSGTPTTGPPTASTPSESTSGATPPSGSNSSAAAPSYRIDGALLLVGSLVLAVASL